MSESKIGLKLGSIWEVVCYDADGKEKWREVNENLVERQLQIALMPDVIDWVIEMTCNDRSYGARPLRRAIQRYIEDPLSEELIRGDLTGGDIEVYLDGGVLAYRPAGLPSEGRRLA